MKNIFSFQLYLQGLKKIRVAGIAIAVSLIALNAWTPMELILNQSAVGFPPDVGTFAPFGYLLVLFAPLLVYNMFSYLNDRKGADFFHALPQKRICIYISFMFAVFTWIVAMLFVSTLVNAILWTASGVYIGAPLKAAMVTPLNFLLLAVVSAGFMALAMTLTGTAAANVFVFLTLFVFLRVCLASFVGAFANITPMFNLNYSALKIFDWDYFLPVALLEQALGSYVEACQSVRFYLYWIAVGIALLAISALTYCRRRSENATKSAPNRILHHVYRICLTLPFFVFGILVFITESLFVVGLLSILGGLLVWSLFELLTVKKIAGLARSLPLLLIPAILTGGYVGSVYLAKNNFYASTPKREKIASVKIEEPSHVFGSDENWDLLSAMLHTSEIKDSTVLDDVYDMIQNTKKDPNLPSMGMIYKDAVVTVTMKSGRKVTYNLHPYVDLNDTFCRSEEFLAHAFAFDFEVLRIESDLQTQKMQHVWEVFKEELAALDGERKRLYLHWNDQGIMRNREYFTVYGSYRGAEFCQPYVLIEEYTPNAYRLYTEYATEDPAANLEAFRTASEQIRQNAAYKVGDVNLYVDNGGIDWVFHCYDKAVITSFLRSLTLDSHLTDYENAEIYRVVLWADLKGTESGTVIDQTFGLTLSEEDIARYRQLAEEAGLHSSYWK